MMKTTTYLQVLLFFLLLVGVHPCLSAQGTQVVVNEEAGKLQTKLADLTGVVDLTVEGPINDADLKAVANAFPSLVSLNLEKTNIKGFMDPYDPYSSTPDNCFPTGLSFKLKELQSLVLPASITKVYAYALGGLQALKRLVCPTPLVPGIEGWGTDLTDSNILTQCSLYVQPEQVDAFKNHDAWKGFSTILPIQEGPEPIVADLSMEVASTAIFSITVQAIGDKVTVHYPDGTTEEKAGEENKLSLNFQHTLDEAAIPANASREILISAPTAVRITTQSTQLQSATFLQDLPTLQEVSLRWEDALKSLDLSTLSALTDINLTYCSSLTDLKLPASAPALKRLILSGVPMGQIAIKSYTALQEVDLSSIGISEIDVLGLTNLTSLDLSDNALQALDLTGLTNLATINVAYNQLKELSIPSSKLEELNIERNQISTIDLSHVTEIGTFYCNNNNFSLAALPIKGAVISSYIYAPQAKHTMPNSIAAGEVIDLSDLDQLQGILTAPVASTYSWYDKSGNFLSEGSDYQVPEAGKFVFLQPFPDGVFCRIKTKAFPKFELKNSYETTPIIITEATGEQPAIVLSTPGMAGQKVSFSIRVTEGAYQIDWGNGVLKEGTALFASGTIEGDVVKVYGPISAFTANNAGVTDVQLNAPELTLLNLNDNQLSQIAIPESDKLNSLALQNNNLSQLSLPNLPALNTLNLKGNKLSELVLREAPLLKRVILVKNQLTTLDLSNYPNLTSIRVDDNKLTTISFPSSIEELYADNNQLSFEGVSFSDLPQLQRLRLCNNQISRLTVSDCPLLNDLELRDNILESLTLQGVPMLKTLWLERNLLSMDKLPALSIGTGYKYAPQAKHPMPEIVKAGEVIDLSTLDQLQGILTAPVASTFSWYDKSGNLLVEGSDYQVSEAGKFVFSHPFSEGVYCRIGSEAFPDFTLDNSYETTPIIITEAEIKSRFVFYTDSPQQSFSVKTVPNGTVQVRCADGALLESVGDNEYGIARFSFRVNTDQVADPSHMKMEVLSEQILSFTAQQTGITEVLLNESPLLMRLTLAYQKLKKIDLSSAQNLKELYLQGNEALTNIDVTGLNQLQWINVSNIPNLTSIDLSQLPNLTHLIAFNTQCANLPVELCPNLQMLDLTNTGTSAVDVSSLTGLELLLLADNQIETLALDRLANLTELNVSKNKLSQLTLVSERLSTLNVADNLLSTLDISQAQAITSLYCDNNQLSLSALPTLPIDGAGFVYAPQAAMKMPQASFSTDDEIDLSAEANLQGVLSTPVASTFTCYNAKTNDLLSEGVDYETLRSGVFRFKHAVADGVYFVISTAAYPAFVGEKAFRTESFEVQQGNAVEAPTQSPIVSIQYGSDGLIATATEAVSFRLYSTDGVLIQSGVLQTGTTSLPLRSGNYLLVYRHNGVVYIIKIARP